MFTGIDSQQMCDVIDFLDQNKETIIWDLTPDVMRFLENKDDFGGVFNLYYNEALENFIIKRIQEVIAEHFEEINREDMLTKYDAEFLNLFGFDDLLLEETYRGIA